MEINDINIKRYLESYKRMFFKNQLDDLKSKIILEKRKEALELKEIDLSEKEEALKNSLTGLIDFIKSILKENEILEEENLQEIKSYIENEGLDLADIDLAIELAKTLLNDFEENENNSNSLKEEPKEISQEEINEYMTLFENNYDELFENDEFFNKYLDINNKEFKLESLKLLFYNGCLICFEKLKEKILNIDLEEVHKKERILIIFQDCYGDLINYTYNILVKEEVCEKNFPKGTLFERIFGLQCLDTLTKQMNKIGIMNKNNVPLEEIKKSLEKSKNVYLSNSNKEYFKTKSIYMLEEEMEKIYLDFTNKNNGTNSIKHILNELFIEAMKFINKCAIANFNIYTEDYGRDLNELFQIREVVNSSIKSRANYLSDLENYMDILNNSIKKYPYSEELYVELGYFKTNIFVKYNYLNRAIDIIDNCGEKNSKLLEEIKATEIEFYREQLNLIPDDISIDLKKILAEYVINKFNLKDNVDVIFEGEIDKFGSILSNIDIENVDLNLRAKGFRKELIKAKKENLTNEELANLINENKFKYSISDMEAFKSEYSVFGFSSEIDIFENLDVNGKKSLLEHCMNAIKELEFDEIKRKEALLELRERNILEKNYFREIQYEVFGEVIPLTEEEIKEIEFAESVKTLYTKYLEKVINLDIHVREKNGTIKIPEFYKVINRNEDSGEVVFVYSEQSNFSSKREYFLITTNKVYSSYENNYIYLKDIVDINVKSYSRVIKGERIYFEGIFVNTEEKEFKLCSNLTGGKDHIESLINEILESYREIFKIEKILDLQSNIEDMVGFMEETSSLENKKLVESLKLHLEGNKFYDLMSDLLNCGNTDIKEIILEISKIIGGELGKKIYFKDLTSGYSEKLSNACASYVLEFDKAEEVLFVYDNSRFGSAKEGFIITDKGIYCKNRMDNPWSMELRYIDSVKVKDNNKIILNNRVIEFAHIKTKEQLYEMRDLLELIIFINTLELDNNEEDKSPIMTYIMELLNSIKSENLRKYLYMHTEGRIAEKKFNSAINSYAELEENEKPLLLFDSTVFAFGNSGFMVTTKNIYSKEAMGKPIRFNLGAVYNVKFKDGNFYINSVLLKLNGLDEKDKEELANVMAKIVEFLKENFFKKATN